MGRFLFAHTGSAGRKRSGLVVGRSWRRRRRENLSLLFQDYYSAVTSHFTHSGDRELAGRRAAQGLCGEEGEKKTDFLFLTQENPGVGDKRCVEAATCERQFNLEFSGSDSRRAHLPRPPAGGVRACVCRDVLCSALL